MHDIKAEIESTSDIAEKLIEQTENQKTLNEEQSNKLDQIVQGIYDNDDILFKVNCLQLLSSLATSKVFLARIESLKVPQKILSILEENDKFIIPHALKFFHRLNPFDVEIKFPQAIDLVCNYFKSDDPQILDYGIDFIATVGRGGYLARKVLERHPLFKRVCLPKLGSLLCSSSPLLKERSLICVKDLLEVYPSEPKSETMGLSKSFYSFLMENQDNMTKQLVKLCHMPIKEVQNAAIELANALSTQKWAPVELRSIKANEPVPMVG